MLRLQELSTTREQIQLALVQKLPRINASDAGSGCLLILTMRTFDTCASTCITHMYVSACSLCGGGGEDLCMASRLVRGGCWDVALWPPPRPGRWRPRPKPPSPHRCGCCCHHHRSTKPQQR